MSFNPVEYLHWARSIYLAELEAFRPDAVAFDREQVFVVPNDILSGASQLSSKSFEALAAEIENGSPMEPDLIPNSAVLPAESCILWLEGYSDAGAVIRCSSVDGRTQVETVTDDGRQMLGSFVAGEANITVTEEYYRSDEKSGLALGLLWQIAFVLSLIGQPNFVKRQPAVSRQARRRMQQRGGGIAVDAWTRVSWNIGKDVVAKLSRDPSFHRQPLHFRRAHWRIAEPRYAGKVWLDAKSAPRRPGWYIRIPEAWPGHPAFGIKKSYHAPRFRTPGGQPFEVNT